MFFPRARVLFLSVDVQPAFMDTAQAQLREQLERMTLLRQRMAENEITCWQVGEWWPETPTQPPASNGYRPLLPALKNERLFGKRHKRAPVLNHAFIEAVKAFKPQAVIAQGCYLELCVLDTLQLVLDTDRLAGGQAIGFLLTDCGRSFWRKDEKAPVEWGDAQPISRLQLNLSAAGLSVDAPPPPHRMVMQAATEDERNFG